MKLYGAGRAPNPRRVRVFLAEKGIAVPVESIDIAALEHRTDAFRAINPLQRIPALTLDDGAVITESIAICRYFEALQPEPPLFGTGAKEQAMVEMWQRRLEFHLLTPVSYVFRHLHPAMREMEAPQVPAWGEANKAKALAFLGLLEGHLRDRAFVATDALSVADITGLIAIDFMRVSKLDVPDDLAEVRRWHAALAARPSAAA